MALEVEVIDGRRTAYIRQQSDIHEISDCTGIESLWVMEDCFGWLREPLNLPGLKVLYVSSNTLPIVDLLNADCLVGIEWLLVASSPGSLTGLSSFGAFAGLSRLKIRQQSLLEVELNWVLQQSAIQFLSITDVPVDDVAIASLSCQSTLKRLDLYRTAIRMESSMLDGSRFGAVRSLDVSDTSVGSNSVSRMESSFPSIERFIATGTLLNHTDVARIRKWPNLRVLETGYKDLDFDNVNDSFWDL
jgi:hypothetical protein